MSIKEKVRNIIKEATLKTIQEKNLSKDDLPEIIVEIPKIDSHGNLSSNIAFLLANMASEDILKTAENIVKNIEREDIVEKVEIAGKGFINIFIAKDCLYKVLCQIEEESERYGCSNFGEEKKVLIEFVSANPTGPLHVGHGRGAVIGDTLANVFSAAGYYVEKEYYINNVGKQAELLGTCVEAEYKNLIGIPMDYPEDGYKGDYIKDLAEKLVKMGGKRYQDWGLDFFVRFTVREILDDIKNVLLSFQVRFNRMFSENTLYDSGKVDECIDILKEKGYTYEKDGALWLKTTAFNDDKDRVLIRENNVHTYFAGDVAYHKDKLSREYSKIINILGADHHGYTPRMECACEIIGYQPGLLEYLLYQLVNLMRDGIQVSMSTRTGEYITLQKVIEEVGSDAARFFFVMRKSDVPLDFDLELAKKKSDENPVYYVQYAHARICSILRQAKEKNIENISASEANLDLLSFPEELNLLFKLSILPDEIISITKNLETHRLANYLVELASMFHSYYAKYRVISEDKELTMARLCMCKAVLFAMRSIFKIIAIQAPDKM
ncbi:MAG: arginine--tRNA ligase [bacterium]|nr:arginine--tRNA ligase [bacterium]